MKYYYVSYSWEAGGVRFYRSRYVETLSLSNWCAEMMEPPSSEFVLVNVLEITREEFTGIETNMFWAVG